LGTLGRGFGFLVGPVLDYCFILFLRRKKASILSMLVTNTMSIVDGKNKKAIFLFLRSSVFEKKYRKEHIDLIFSNSRYINYYSLLTYKTAKQIASWQ
jgi:hypothetical protein